MAFKDQDRQLIVSFDIQLQAVRNSTFVALASAGEKLGKYKFLAVWGVHLSFKLSSEQVTFPAYF